MIDFFEIILMAMLYALAIPGIYIFSLAFWSFVLFGLDRLIKKNERALPDWADGPYCDPDIRNHPATYYDDRTGVFHNQGVMVKK
jgi:hypothetical protein